MSTNTKDVKSTEVKEVQETQEVKEVVTTGFVTNKTILDTILESKGDEKIMDNLFKQYPDLFINVSSKYLPADIKVKAEKIIQTVFPQFKFTSAHKRTQEEKLQALIEGVKQKITDKVDKNEIIDLILNNRKSDIKTILVSIL